MPITNETEIMREMWRLAYSRKEGVTIPCPDKSSAMRLRFALYNAVKLYRNGKDEADSALTSAIANCQLAIGEDNKSVVMKRKLDSATNKAMLAILGNAMPQSVDDAMALESMARIMERVQETLAPEPTKDDTVARRYGARG